jgi:hypothetical protein
MSVKKPYYTIIPCCPQGTMTGNFNITGILVADGVYKYTGSTYQDATTGMWFYKNFCYTIDYIDDVIPTFPIAFNSTNISLTLGDICTSIDCPDCNFIPAGIYYSFESCCTGEIVLLNGPTDPNSQFYFYWSSLLPAVGIYDWLNDVPLPISESLGLIQGACYLMTEIIGNDASLPNLPSLGGAPGQLFSLTDERTTCYVPDPITGEPELFAECGQCPPCYLLMSCDSTVAPFTTNQDLSAYLYSVTGQSWLMTGSDFDDVCFTVLLAPSNIPCNWNASPIIVGTTCDCPCICYTVIANAKDCAYVDCDGNLQYTGPLVTSPPEKFCSLAYPAIIGNVLLPTGPSPIYIQNEGPCIDGECPVICYLLEDCDGIEDPIYSTSTSLLPYAIIGSVITIVGYPNTCWEIIDTAECDCAIDVSVINSYGGCLECLGTPKYKLTNCDSVTTVVYTTTDLSAYVGEVIIRLDCPGCWIVEEVDLIPSDVPITVSTSYIGCPECARTYYLLEDCSGYLPDVITYTDLSAYVGDVIKLEYCPETCWEVSISLDSTNAGEVVFIDQEYADCDECLLTLPCICITVRNDSTTSKEYRYYDCILDVQFFTLLPGETSGKFCIRAWAIYYPTTDYIETFGNCTQATVEDPWTCPAPIYPRRSVQPGYATPACTIERYEKISCKSSEIYYKQVLNLRYGISNCCPDENNKWLIKKELIDMDAMRDPDYICTVANSCCTNKSSCNCDSCNCNQSITTCNSQ